MEIVTLKEKFVKWMIPQTFVGSNGIIMFPYADVFHDPELQYISDDPGYKILKKKMKNFLKLINKDINYGFIDIETDLWYKI